VALTRALFDRSAGITDKRRRSATQAGHKARVVSMWRAASWMSWPSCSRLGLREGHRARRERGDQDETNVPVSLQLEDPARRTWNRRVRQA
jgi:hypothetical protein